MGLSNATAVSMQEEEGLRDPAKDQEDKKEKKSKHSLKTKNLWDIGYICILMLAVLLILVVYDTADGEHGTSFSSCDRNGWKWVQLYGSCWNSLIKLPATTTWMDIAVIIGCALMLFGTVALGLYRCTNLPKKYQLERCYRNVMIMIATVMMFIVILKACFFSQLYLTSARPEQANAISSQLSKSLLKYGHDGGITRAWQNTMRDGCCCGLYGHQDFTNIGVDVPPHCGCYDEEEQHCFYKGCTRRCISNLNRLSDCTASPLTNFTNAGCLSFVVDKVDGTTKSVAVAQVVSLMVSAVIILVISARASKEDTMDGDADSAKGQNPQKKSEKKTVYIFKGSLSKKLVLATLMIIPVILLTITVKFYLYYSHPAVCTDSPGSWTSWISIYNIRPCWSDLGSFIPQYGWFAYIITLCFGLLLLEFLISLLTVLKIYKQSPEVSVPVFFGHEVLAMVMMHGYIGVVGIYIYFNLNTLTYSPSLRDTVHSQLNESLPRYHEDGFLLREAWDITMADGCCGVDGYQDFINLNMSIPSVCQVDAVSSSCVQEVSDASKNKTFAIGCVDTVMIHIIENENRRVLAVLWLMVLNMFILLATKFATMGPCLMKKSQSGLKGNQLKIK